MPNNISQYEILRPQFTTAGVVEYRGTDIIGADIRAITGYGVNHSELVIVMQSPYTGVKRAYTHGALSDGTVPEYLSNTLAKYNGIAYWYPLKPEYESFIADIEKRAFDFLGRDYDWAGLAENLLGHTKVQMEGREFCSEYVQICCWNCNDAIKNNNIALWPGELTEKGGIWQTPGYQLMEPINPEEPDRVTPNTINEKGE
jgi:hypothetical protein